MAKKKATYNEMKEVLKNFNSIPKEKQQELAVRNKMTVEELLAVLQENCYKLTYLGINQKKALLREMQKMSVEELAVVESVNRMHHTKIMELLNEEINHHSEISKKQRAFNNAWKIRKQEVLTQLIEAGVIQPKEGYFLTDITMIKELATEYESLRKEFGL